MLQSSAALFSRPGPIEVALLYLDPGSGSILLQVLLAALLGIGILIRTQWARIRKWFGHKPTEPSGEEDDR